MIVEERLPVYQNDIDTYCQQVIITFKPVCIILHGSIARRTFTLFSDIDLIVISHHFNNNFLERLFDLSSVYTGNAPIEALGYTVEEWGEMMARKHLTVLEALHWGVPLYGEEIFVQWQTKLSEWKSLGLSRGEHSWWIPPILRNGRNKEFTKE